MKYELENKIYHGVSGAKSGHMTYTGLGTKGTIGKRKSTINIMWPWIEKGILNMKHQCSFQRFSKKSRQFLKKSG